MFDPFNEKRNALLVHYATNGAPERYNAIRQRFPDGDELFELAEKGSPVLYDGLTDTVRERMKTAASDGFLDRLGDKLDELGVEVVLKEEDAYPALLREINLAPNLLFVRGGLPNEAELPIAMVLTLDRAIRRGI